VHVSVQVVVLCYLCGGLIFSMHGCNLFRVGIAQMRKDAYGWIMNSDDLSPRKRKCVVSNGRIKNDKKKSTGPMTDELRLRGRCVVRNVSFVCFLVTRDALEHCALVVP
jgi:hypothetical protein